VSKTQNEVIRSKCHWKWGATKLSAVTRRSCHVSHGAGNRWRRLYWMPWHGRMKMAPGVAGRHTATTYLGLTRPVQATGTVTRSLAFHNKNMFGTGSHLGLNVYICTTRSTVVSIRENGSWQSLSWSVNYPPFMEPRSSLLFSQGACHWTLSWAGWIQSTPTQSNTLRPF
jgi:hypothetical protein